MLDHLVNNAVIFYSAGTADMTVNVRGPTRANLPGAAFLSGAWAKDAKPHPGCSIVTITSMNAVTAEEDSAAPHRRQRSACRSEPSHGMGYCRHTYTLTPSRRNAMRAPLSEVWIETPTAEDITRMAPMKHTGNP